MKKWRVHYNRTIDEEMEVKADSQREAMDIILRANPEADIYAVGDITNETIQEKHRPII